MTLEAIIRRVHRISAILFLLAVFPAGYFSVTGNPASPSPVVYIPLIFLLGLSLTGIYQLVKPWIRQLRAPGG
jgi:hypothetical protein